MSLEPQARRKRFYKDVTTSLTASGACRVELDGRVVRTPARRELAVGNRELAEAIADEWRAQGEYIEPASMPLTRIANSALDGVAGREAEVRADVLAYASSDLLCYLADGPAELIERQSRRWGAIHAWAKREYGIELELAVGVMPVEQSSDMRARFDAALGELTALDLAALHTVTTLTGSALLALAVLHRHIEAAQAWALAHIDEDFQIEKWGTDEEAAGRRERRRIEMEAACLMLDIRRR